MMLVRIKLAHTPLHCAVQFQLQAAMAKLRSEKDEEIAAQAEILADFNKKARIMLVSCLFWRLLLHVDLSHLPVTKQMVNTQHNTRP